MEHILGITIDDDVIAKNISQNIERKLSEEIEKKVRRFCGNDWDSNFYLKDLFTEEIKNVIEQNKEEIINKSIEQLTKNMMRTKLVKGKLNEEQQ